MPKIFFSHEADVALENFIQQYVDSFVKLYKDTGIWSSQMIMECYLKGAEGIYQQIRTAIIEKLSEEKVLGRKPSRNISELNFHVGKRLIIIFFYDDTKSDERWIESIFIGKKPILF